jgi:hypothetical protein
MLPDARAQCDTSLCIPITYRMERQMIIAKATVLFCLLSAHALAVSVAKLATASNEYKSVEIRVGTDGQSAEQMAVLYQGGASKGQVFRSPEEGQRLCGRRDAMPGSSSGGWSGWYCASSYKGVQVGQPSNTNF